MIYSIFNMFGQAFSFGWNTIVSLVEASGMTKPVFIGLLISLLVLSTVFGTLRARAFSGGDKVDEATAQEMFERDVERAQYRSAVSKEAAWRNKGRGGYSDKFDPIHHNMKRGKK